MNSSYGNLGASLVANYICSTLEGNNISRIYYAPNFKVWKIQNVRFKGDEVTFDIRMYEGDEVKTINNNRLTGSKSVERVKKIVEESKKNYNGTENANVIFSSKLYDKALSKDRYEERTRRVLLILLTSAAKRFGDNIDFYSMSNEKITRFLMSAQGIKYSKWCRLFDNYNASNYYLYQIFGLEEYCYRYYANISKYEEEAMLKYAGIQPKRNENVILKDPFYNKIYIEKKIEEEIKSQVWVEPELVREWDYEWTSYYKPGYYKETSKTKEYLVTEEVPFQKRLDACEYCLKKRIYPKLLRKDAL